MKTLLEEKTVKVELGESQPNFQRVFSKTAN
jgi:hypothetical protein